MKKIIAILLILSCIAVFAACGKNEEDDGKALETAETYVEITGNAGSLTLDENVARTLLEVYDKEILGLSKDIYEYELKLSATRFMEKDACLVEAFLEGAEKPEGTFVILGQQCYVYNSKKQKYLLLTVDGQVVESGSPDTTQVSEPSSTEKAFEYDEENNKKLHERFDSYTKEQLGLKKEITEYILVVPGTTTTADDGKTVFVVRLYEKDGKVINDTVSFNDDGSYMFDYEANKYKKIA